MASITGLTAAEVEARRAAGQTNRPPQSQTRTTGEIVRDNICTYFNLVFLVLAVMLALVHSWLNMGFLGIVFWNTLIGIVQQLRAKKTIDKLTLVSARKVRCLRDGKWCAVLSDDLVKDDVVEFGTGDQIVADAVVVDGSAQANESLITGEARAVPKERGAELRSGSFLMAGRCMARLTHVGAESYASKLTAEAQANGHNDETILIVVLENAVAIAKAALLCGQALRRSGRQFDTVDIFADVFQFDAVGTDVLNRR